MVCEDRGHSRNMMMAFSLPLTEPGAPRGRQLPETKGEGHREEGWDEEEWEVSQMYSMLQLRWLIRLVHPSHECVL